MKLPRRNFLHLAAGAAALPAFARLAVAQAYPSRPVRIVVGFPPAGGADIIARLIGQWLSERFGQQFIIENRPGAASNIATETVVRAPADGYTLLLVTIPNVINATLYDKLNYNFIRDITPVASIDRVPNVMEVHPSVPTRTVPEFIAYAKANPAKINMASGGNGTSQHVAGELFKMMTGVNLVHVPYRGARASVCALPKKPAVATKMAMWATQQPQRGVPPRIGCDHGGWCGSPEAPTTAASRSTSGGENHCAHIRSCSIAGRSRESEPAICARSTGLHVGGGRKNCPSLYSFCTSRTTELRDE